MKRIVPLTKNEIKPDYSTLMSLVGIPDQELLRNRIGNILEQGFELFYDLADPKGILREISVSQFNIVYLGEGNNEPDTPISKVFPRADNLALFAVTMGQSISSKITELFDQRDYALAYILDAIASEATEQAADLVENHFSEILYVHTGSKRTSYLMRYSPGYCGWHISGQAKVFDYLKPGDIGITLSESYLMKPLKSISGVLVSGEEQIHYFENNFPFCRDCPHSSCRERLRNIMKN